MSPELSDIAQRLTKEHEEAVQQLSGQSATAFDQAYVGHEIHMHEQVLSMVTEALKSSDDPQVKRLLTQARPALERHLSEAQRLRTELSGSKRQ